MEFHWYSWDECGFRTTCPVLIVMYYVHGSSSGLVSSVYRSNYVALFIQWCSLPCNEFVPSSFSNKFASALRSEGELSPKFFNSLRAAVQSFKEDKLKVIMIIACQSWLSADLGFLTAHVWLFWPKYNSATRVSIFKPISMQVTVIVISVIT